MRAGIPGAGARARVMGRPAIVLCILLLGAAWTEAALSQGTLQELGRLSLQDLGEIVVTSVAKNPEPLAGAPAAVYVISHDEIMRSGATTLPEIMRLAPNLGVFQLTPSNYIVTSRGLSGNQSAQNFPNKLLVLIDGRSVYSPLFSGIYWDQLHVLPENIERIEVISGPAGALWGANAVNGVINIITRSASDTQGGLLELGAGNHQRSAALQYGGQLGERAWYRVYARAFRQGSYDTEAGVDAQDGWRAPQAGFRIDWNPDIANDVMLEGNLLETREGQPGAPDVRTTSGNLLAGWRHESASGSTFQLRTYVDRSNSGPSLATGGGSVTTWDVEVQQDFALGDRHHVTWGAGDRIYQYRIRPAIRPQVSLLWTPTRGTQNLVNVFVQDQVTLAPRVHATIGVKAERDPYSGWSWMPSVRLAWKATDSTLLWAAVSRAARTPTVFDTSVHEVLNTPTGPLEFLRGNPDYRSEKLTAYEAGLRTQWNSRATLSVSIYYNNYHDLRAIQTGPGGGFPFVFANGMEGSTWGADLWASYAVTDWWRLGAGWSEERERMEVRPGFAGDPGMAGNDPRHRGFVRSSMNLGDHWKLDADLRAVGALPDPRVPGYRELNARLGWTPNEQLEISLSGMNLLHPWHQEYVFPFADRIGRTVFLDARLKF